MASCVLGRMDLHDEVPQGGKVKISIIPLLVLIATKVVAEDKCDCTIYPFKPNPPCYGECVKALSANTDTDLSKVKNLDAGVSVGIKVLADSPERSGIDFESIRGKSDLEKAALESLDDGSGRLRKPIVEPGGSVTPHRAP